jgi:hypothetical protein
MTTSEILANSYYPDSQRTVPDTTVRIGLGLANTAGINVLREFWPDIKRKFVKPAEKKVGVPDTVLHAIGAPSDRGTPPTEPAKEGCNPQSASPSSSCPKMR